MKTIKEPKIYSISTVGILKHFHQDYLTHPLRTDFTGGNGVGKSIIADLIQIIFICYERHIKFGTEGFTNDKREIRKLPYKNTEAYAFLNIKIEEDRFITIGVNILTRASRKIRPFVVLSKPDLNLQLPELVYDSSKILTHKDFLDEQCKIFPLDELSKRLKEKHQLYLTYFSYKEEIERYHHFLFDKEILSINLTIPEHLKAFAKVIQSFSRVKDLGLNKANSLKEFLFEDDDKEFLEEYQKHKLQLERLLTDYEKLNIHIDNIEQKQEALNKLNTLEKHRDDARFNYDVKEIAELHHRYMLSQTQGKKLEEDLIRKAKRKDFLDSREKKFKEIVPNLESYYEEIDSNYTLLLQYKSTYKEWKQFETEIGQLREMQFDEFSEETKNNSLPVDFTEIKTEDILKQVSTAIPLFKQYGQLNDIIGKYDEQQEKLSELQLHTDNRLNQLDRIIRLLADKGANSLFVQIVGQKKTLSLHQESVLLALIDLSLKKPEKAYTGLRYALSTDILNEENFEFDKPNNGVWLKLGELREFIQLSEEKRIFAPDSDFENILSDKIDELNIQIKELKHEKEELDKIKKSQHYNKEIIKDYDFDIRLINYSVIENLRQAVWMIFHKEIKIAQLLSDSQQLKSDVEAIKEKITIPVDTQNLSGLINKYQVKKEVTLNRKKATTNKRYIETRELSGLEVKVPQIEKELEEKQKETSESLNAYNTKKQLFDERHPEIDIQIQIDSIQTKSFDELKSNSDKAQESYILEYRSTANLFAETKEGKNPQVNMQINNEHYQFRILEEVLLGGKIGHLDKVSDYLREANRQRLSFIGSIRDNMIKVFSKTLSRYQYYETLVKSLNTFFIGKKISESYYLNLKFNGYNDIDIGWIDQLQTSLRWVNKPGEFEFGQSVQEFIEEIFKKITGQHKTIEFKDLLNPKTYFDLEPVLTDEDKNEIPGSTGETYSALVLLGIARLSKVQDKKRGGLKFIILEELGNLDDVNFNLFPEIAEEYHYQLLTMTPKPYNSDSKNGWYLYTLIKGFQDKNINYPVPASYYKTRGNRIDLDNYLKALEK